MQTCGIKSIKHIKVPLQSVYDITTEHNHNFILKNGSVLHNCDTGQMLKSKGYPYDVLSVDRVDTDRICKPYQYFKSTIYDKRIEMYEDKTLIDEIINLERNIETGKVDHPDGGCFTGETEVCLVDGRSLSFLGLVDEYNQGKENYVYSINLNTRKIEPKKILKAWKTKENQPLVRITFDNNQSVECTLNHRFMLRNGEYIEAQDLTPGDKLKSLNTLVSILNIEFIDKTADVYDIEVEDNHNFALSAGVFVHNSKDKSDAMCGAVYNASKHAEEFAYDYGESSEELLRLNSNTDLDDMQQLTLNLEEEIKRMRHQNLLGENTRKLDAGTDDYFLLNDNIIDIY